MNRLEIYFHAGNGGLTPCYEVSSRPCWGHAGDLGERRLVHSIAMPDLGFSSQPLGSIVTHLHFAACWTVESPWPWFEALCQRNVCDKPQVHQQKQDLGDIVDENLSQKPRFGSNREGMGHSHSLCGG